MLVGLELAAGRAVGGPSSWQPSWWTTCARSSWPRWRPTCAPCRALTVAEFAALAESMGLARVVRSMEILGRALMDMRDAPDAQVVLEIARGRGDAGPDLDSGIEALTERVAVLERAWPPAAYRRPTEYRARAAPFRGDCPRAGTRLRAPAAESAPVAPTADDLVRRPSLGRSFAARRPRPGPRPRPSSAAPVRAEGGVPGPPTTEGPAGPPPPPSTETD